MTICSVLTPFILLSDCKKASETVSSYFSIPAEDFSLYALVPLDQASNVSEIAIRLHRSTYSIQNVEALLIENQQLISHLNRSKETILTMKTQVLRKNNLYYDEKYMRRMEKLKKLNEDNRKLRELLKVQLENSEALRLETQNTVEVLREEFEKLAQEINKNPKNNPKSTIKVPQMKIKDLKQR